MLDENENTVQECMRLRQFERLSQNEIVASLGIARHRVRKILTNMPLSDAEISALNLCKKGHTLSSEERRVLQVVQMALSEGGLLLSGAKTLL